MNDVGKILMVTGLGIAGLGALIWLAGKIGLPLGRLPGDIRIDRDTLVMWLLRRR